MSGSRPSSTNYCKRALSALTTNEASIYVPFALAVAGFFYAVKQLQALNGPVVPTVVNDAEVYSNNTRYPVNVSSIIAAAAGWLGGIIKIINAYRDMEAHIDETGENIKRGRRSVAAGLLAAISIGIGGVAIKLSDLSGQEMSTAGCAAASGFFMYLAGVFAQFEVAYVKSPAYQVAMADYYNAHPKKQPLVPADHGGEGDDIHYGLDDHDSNHNAADAEQGNGNGAARPNVAMSAMPAGGGAGGGHNPSFMARNGSAAAAALAAQQQHAAAQGQQQTNAPAKASH